MYFAVHLSDVKNSWLSLLFSQHDIQNEHLTGYLIFHDFKDIRIRYASSKV